MVRSANQSRSIEELFPRMDFTDVIDATLCTYKACKSSCGEKESSTGHNVTSERYLGQTETLLMICRP